MSVVAQGRPYRPLLVFLGPVVAGSVLLFCDLDPEQPAVTRTAAVAVLMAIWWVTEAVPLAVTSLLPVVLLPALGVMDGKAVASEYFNHIVFLFIGGFMVALALEKWGLHRRIALRVLLLFGTRPAHLLLGVMVVTALLSMWISNTATTMMMLAIVLAVVLKMESGGEKAFSARYSVALLLGLAYSASIGGIATLVGTPPNLSFIRIFERTFPEAPAISFTQWMSFALPVSAVMLLLAWLVLLLVAVPRKGGVRADSRVLKKEYESLGKPSFEECAVFVVFLCLVMLWIFRSDISLGGFQVKGWESLFANPGYLNDGVVAMAMATILFLIPSRQEKGKALMDWSTASKIPWQIILLFGGGFALAVAISESGLAAWLGNILKDAAPDSTSVLVVLLCLMVTFMTELTSNIATTEMVLPIVAGLAGSLQLNPLFLMVPVTLSCSFAFMMPVATAPNAIVFGSERIRVIDMVRVGLLLNLLGVAVISAAVFTLGPSTLGLDPAVVPSWVGGR